MPADLRPAHDLQGWHDAQQLMSHVSNKCVQQILEWPLLMLLPSVPPM